MEAQDEQVDYQEAHWKVIEVSAVAYVEETTLKRVLAKLEPMVSSYRPEGSIAATVGTGIAAT